MDGSDDTVFSRKEKVQSEKEKHRLAKRSLLQVINLPLHFKFAITINFILN
jgi:hypothetical protein